MRHFTQVRFKTKQNEAQDIFCKVDKEFRQLDEEIRIESELLTKKEFELQTVLSEYHSRVEELRSLRSANDNRITCIKNLQKQVEKLTELKVNPMKLLSIDFQNQSAQCTLLLETTADEQKEQMEIVALHKLQLNDLCGETKAILEEALREKQLMESQNIESNDLKLQIQELDEALHLLELDISISKNQQQMANEDQLASAMREIDIQVNLAALLDTKENTQREVGAKTLEYESLRQRQLLVEEQQAACLMEIVHQKEEVVRALTQSKFNIKSLEFKEAEVRNQLLDEELLTESVSLDLTRMEEANKAEYAYQNIIESFFGMVCDQIDYENCKAKNHIEEVETQSQHDIEDLQREIKEASDKLILIKSNNELEIEAGYAALQLFQITLQDLSSKLQDVTMEHDKLQKQLAVTKGTYDNQQSEKLAIQAKMKADAHDLRLARQKKELREKTWSTCQEFQNKVLSPPALTQESRLKLEDMISQAQMEIEKTSDERFDRDSRKYREPLAKLAQAEIILLSKESEWKSAFHGSLTDCLSCPPKALPIAEEFSQNKEQGICMTGYTVSSLSGNTNSIADCLEDNQTNSTACVNQSRIAVVVRSDETGNETESSGSLFCEQLFHGETSKINRQKAYQELVARTKCKEKGPRKGVERLRQYTSKAHSTNFEARRQAINAVQRVVKVPNKKMTTAKRQSASTNTHSSPITYNSNKNADAWFDDVEEFQFSTALPRK